MKPESTLNFVFALPLAGTAPLGHAQTPDPATGVSPTRMQTRMQTKEFLNTRRWDEATEVWVLKAGIEPPVGVVSRAAVKAKRDEYMRLYRWDEPTDTWIARNPVSATPSTLAREQVLAQTVAVTHAHHGDEETEAWVLNAPRRMNWTAAPSLHSPCHCAWAERTPPLYTPHRTEGSAGAGGSGDVRPAFATALT